MSNRARSSAAVGGTSSVGGSGLNLSGFELRGLVIDDASHLLYESIVDFGRSAGFKIDLAQLSSSGKKNEIIRRARGYDFLVIDHRLDGNFRGYADGLEVVAAVRRDLSRIPVFYLSAFAPDFQEVQGSKRQFTERARFLAEDPRIFYYDKGRLTPKERLPELVAAIGNESVLYAIERFRQVLSGHPSGLLNARPVRESSFEFRVLGSSGRGWVLLRPLDKARGGVEEEVPVRLIKRAGASTRGGYVTLRIVELDNGMVLSGFSPRALRREEISSELLEFIGVRDVD